MGKDTFISHSFCTSGRQIHNGLWTDIHGHDQSEKKGRVSERWKMKDNHTPQTPESEREREWYEKCDDVLLQSYQNKTEL